MFSRVVNKWKTLLPGPKSAESTGAPWLRVAPGVEAAANDNGLTILDTIGGRVFVGSEAAALMWLSGTKGLGIGETAELVAARFGVEQDRAECRVRRFVDLLEQNGLTVRRR